jgi:hypothetical protein
VKQPRSTDTVHVVVVDTRTPVGVAQLVDTMWISKGKAADREREINTDVRRHPNKVAWVETCTIADNGRLVPTAKKHAKGSANGRAQLTEQTVREARERFRSTVPGAQRSTAQLAAEYGVSRQAMSNALMGITWRHVI